MDRTLTHVEYFALIVSALCHDLEHPGVNNPFLVSSRSDLATLYNDRSASADARLAAGLALGVSDLLTRTVPPLPRPAVPVVRTPSLACARELGGVVMRMGRQVRISGAHTHTHTHTHTYTHTYTQIQVGAGKPPLLPCLSAHAPLGDPARVALRQCICPCPKET